MSDKFSQFIRERQYLHNVTPATIEWYRHSFKWLRHENSSPEPLKDAVIRMRAKGLKPTGCNSAIRAINAYLKWPGCRHRVLYLKEDQRVLPTFSLPDIKKLLTYRPKPANRYQRRLHLLILVLLDTGCRIDEVLTLRAADCDLDNLLFTVTGKGRKQRTPARQETQQAKCAARCKTALSAFRYCPTGKNTPRIPAHVRRSLSAERSERFPSPKGSRAFTLDMTRRYADLLTEDLQTVHQKISLLAA